jgi:outer membrane protein assembly factor BamB
MHDLAERTEAVPTQRLAERRPRLWPLVVILCLSAGLLAFTWLGGIASLPRGAMTIHTLLGTTVLATVWLAFLSRLRWWRRLAWLAVEAVLAVGAVSLFRIEGFSGEVIPRLTWRWIPKKDFTIPASALPPQAQADQAIDLTTTTPHDFPRFLGPTGQAMLSGVRLARDWASRAPRQLWRQPIGAGWSGFAVVGRYAVTQEQRGDFELVVCYDARTGSVLWEHRDPVRFSEAMGGDGPRATPTIARGQVFTMGATGRLNCLDGASGRPIWARNILEDHGQPNLSWGKSCSPLVFEDRVVVTLGESATPSLAAYDRSSGEPIWKSGDDKASYATPVLTTLAGRPQIVVVNAGSVSAHDPSDGTILWTHAWPGQFPKCSQPVPIGDDRLFISAGYGLGCSLLELRVDDHDRWAVQELWHNSNLKTRFTNVNVHQGHAYGLDDGVLTCIELSNGARKWKRGRYGHGQVLRVQDLLLVQAESGAVVLVEANSQAHRELAELPALSGKTWNNPALAGRYLLARNAEEAACYELPVDEAPAAMLDAHVGKSIEPPRTRRIAEKK